MPHVVDTNRLLAEDWLTPAQASEIERRSRETMIALAVNTVLCGGIIAATFGLIFWLADAMAVAVAGSIFLLLGGFVLSKGSDLYRMLGNAAAIIGAGMLIGGAGIELVDKYRDIAEPLMILGGALVAVLSGTVFWRAGEVLKLASGSVLLMGGALHLCGIGLAFDNVGGWANVGVTGYAAVLLVLAGVMVNVRFITALAIVPFAQMLDTGTAYFHAAYVFYSPESTLTILQMALLAGLCLWLMTSTTDRYGRHAGILLMMAVIVANLAFLVGSLWGDHVGVSFAEMPAWDGEKTWQENQAIREAFEAQFFTISEHVYSIIWAVLLAAVAFWAAFANRRGLFNATMTFGGIHAYTQMFETFGDEPLAYALGGLAAIPLAWGMWRLNQVLAQRALPA